MRVLVILMAVVAAIMGVLAGVLLLGRGSVTLTPLQQLISKRLYSSEINMSHLEALQQRPKVADAISRLEAAGYCSVYFRVRVTKTHSDATSIGACPDAKVPPGIAFSFTDLWSSSEENTPFALLRDDDGKAYLVGLGKNGTMGADEVEREVVGVINKAIEQIPAAIERTDSALKIREERERKDAEGRKRAQETF